MTISHRSLHPLLPVLAMALLLGACDGPVEPRAPADVEVLSGNDQEGTVGSYLPHPVRIIVTDQHGRPAPGVDVYLEPLDGSAGWRERQTDGIGEVEISWRLGGTAGVQHLRVYVAAFDPVTITALAHPGPPAVATVEPAGYVLDGIGATVLLHGRIEDEFGNQLHDHPVEWGSTDASVVTVDQAGVARAEGPGAATVTARVGDAAGTSLLHVPSGAVSISSITPSVIEPGEGFTIEGHGFGGSPIVRIGGTVAELASTAPDVIQGVLPPSMPCLPEGPVAVEVVLEDDAARAEHPLRVGGLPVSLAPGEAAIVSSLADEGCLDLRDASAEYMISVFHASRSPAAQTDFRVRGGIGAELERSVMPSRPGAPPGVSRSLPDRSPPAAHLELLEANRELLERHRDLIGQPGPIGPSDANALPEVGEVHRFRMPLQWSCSDGGVEILGRVVYVGQHGIVYEDVNSPTAGTVDGALRTLGKDFDSTMYPVVRDYFGDPFAYRAHLTGPRRVTMLFTNRVREETNFAAFVWSGDLFPRGDCAASDQREIFYIRVPEAGADPHAWVRRIRSLVIHEVKHIVSFAERLARAAGSGWYVWEESWLEEATAMMAEEVWARTIFGYDWRQNVRYEDGPWCESRSHDLARWPECENAPIAVVRHFWRSWTYFADPLNRTPFGRVRENDWSFYGSGWSLVRWLIDHTAEDEAEFIRALIADHTRSGIDNLQARSGVDLVEMLSGWALASYADGRGIGVSDPRHSVPSWDTRDVYHGVHADWPDAFPTPHPLQPHAIGPQMFDLHTTGLRGGSAAYFEVATGPDGARTFEVVSATGGAPVERLGAAVLRIR